MKGNNKFSIVNVFTFLFFLGILSITLCNKSIYRNIDDLLQFKIRWNIRIWWRWFFFTWYHADVQMFWYVYSVSKKNLDKVYLAGLRMCTKCTIMLLSVHGHPNLLGRGNHQSLIIQHHVSVNNFQLLAV